MNPGTGQGDHESAMKKLLERRRKIDSALTDVLGDMTAEQKFSLFTEVNKSKAFEDQADLEDVAERCVIASRDLYDHYDIANEYDTFAEFVADRCFEEEEREALRDSSEE